VAKKAICRVIGVIRADRQDAQPFVPSVVQFNVEDDDRVETGDTVEVTLRVIVQALSPTPIASL